MRERRPSFIVGIGGSAGGLVAYKSLVEALPLNTGMAFVIVFHILPDATSQLAQILSRRTKLPVKIASTGMKILANHIYVSSPNTDLHIENLTFRVVSPRTKRNEEVDLFFASLAEAMGPRAVGIVLSGYDGDGTKGCKQIKANGGTTFAQDASAQVGGMPRSAQMAGYIDLVLPPNQIPDELQKLANAAERMAT